MIRPILTIISVMTVLVGCTLHTPVQPTPPAPMPEHYQKRLDSAQLGLTVPWWQVFNDAQLDALMTRALRSNLDLEQAWQRLRQAEAGLRIAGAPLWPTLDASGEAGRQGQPSATGDVTGDSRGLSLAAAYEIDLWGKLRSRKTAARLRVRASREDLRSLYLSITAQLADVYFLRMERQAQLVLTDQTIASNADTLQRVERRYRAGTAPALDVHQSRQTLAAARALRPNFQKALNEAETALAVLVGTVAGKGLDLTTVALPDQTVPWNKGVSAGLLLQRPDVQAAALRLRALDQELAAAIADRLPALSLTGAYGHSTSDLTGTTIDGLVWRLFANLTAPLWDGGRRRAEVDRRRGAVAEALAGYRQTLLVAAKEVEDALFAIRMRRTRLANLVDEVAAADASLRLSTNQYFQGLRDYLEVLNAQRLQFDARSRLIATQRDLLSDRITLARALGGGWTEIHVNERIEKSQEGRSGHGS